MTVATFIDGVGRTQKMALQHLPPVFLFPVRPTFYPAFADGVPTELNRPAEHRFNLLFSRDGFAVYGFVFDKGPQYRALVTKCEWTRRLDKDGILYILADQDRQIKAFEGEVIGRIFPIAEFIRPDVMRGNAHRECWFVARSEKP